MKKKELRKQSKVNNTHPHAISIESKKKKQKIKLNICSHARAMCLYDSQYVKLAKITEIELDWKRASHSSGNKEANASSQNSIPLKYIVHRVSYLLLLFELNQKFIEKFILHLTWK